MPSSSCLLSASCDLHYIPFGELTRNAFIQAFNSGLRDECPNEHVFLSLAPARQIIEAWRINYTTRRPHSALENRTPSVFAKASTLPMQRGETLRNTRGFAPVPMPPPSWAQTANGLKLPSAEKSLNLTVHVAIFRKHQCTLSS